MDENELEVAACHHRISQEAVNMFHGELFGYAMCFKKEFMVPKNIKFCFADVMCKRWKFIGQRAPTIKKQIKPALSVRHGKGQPFDFQVSFFIYNPKILRR